ncbi:MAG: hypothetical protein ACOCY6_00615 [Halodesulfurarchaeum sp.]
MGPGRALVLVVLIVSTVLAAGTVSAEATTGTAPSSGPLVIEGSVAGAANPTDVGETSLKSTESKTIVRTMRFERRPSEPGTVGLTMQFQLPDQVRSLTTAVPDRTAVESTDGFENDGEGNYTWDEQTSKPSIELALEANRTGSYQYAMDSHAESPGGPADSDTDQGYMFVDTGDWAIVSVPGASLWWTSDRSASPVSVDRRTAVDGSGVAGQRMVFLGPVESEERTVDGQHVTLAIPEAASMEAEPTAVLDSLEAASDHLPESPAERSLLIAAPTTVDWEPYGLASGTDAWVRADQPLDTPENVWIHEFVHLRQDFRTAEDARWIEEGMPEYFAALLSLEQGEIDFPIFSDHLDRGAALRHDDVVLAEPDTWSRLANYEKGALVFGTIDYLLRDETGASASASTLFSRLNEHDGEITAATVDEEIASLGGDTVAEPTDEYVTTTATPAVWSKSEHRSVFGTLPARMTTTAETPYEVSGPYRNRSVDELPILVPQERIAIPVSISNTGEATGEYELELLVNGSVVDSKTGTIEGGESLTRTLSFEPTDTGSSVLELAGETWELEVREPAVPTVTDLQVDSNQLKPGESTRITAHVENQDAWPANGTVTINRDGAAIANWSVTLDANERIDRSISSRFDEEGIYEITAGDDVETVAVTDDQTRTATPQSTVSTPQIETRTETPAETPGFSVGVAVLAMTSVALSRRLIGGV